jgi:hypothetical protein
LSAIAFFMSKFTVGTLMPMLKLSANTPLH